MYFCSNYPLMNFRLFTTAALIVVFSSVDAISQVGVGTTNPQATLEIESKSTTLPVLRLLDDSGNEFFRAQNNQRVGFGENNPVFPVDIKGSENNSVAEIENIRTGGTADVLNLRLGSNTPSSGNQFLRFLSGSGAIGSVSGDGSGGVLYNTTSDKRLKENIRSSRYGLDDVLDIRVVDYNFISTSNSNTETGMLAQDLYRVFPQAVSKGSEGALDSNDPDAIWAVDYGKLTPILIKAIQEQQSQIEELKKEIELLKERP